jgi:AcrR family transcriptional regulator
MARPRSEDKRNAILAAAIAVMAEHGLAASTAAIARQAGVAEGTLFTYFSSKDILLNDLYLTLKSQLGEMMMASFPAAASIRARAAHVWDKYVSWGVAHPQQRKVLSQLGLSERVSEHSKTVAMQAFAAVNVMMEESLAQHVLREQPPPFIGAIMVALADISIDFIGQFPQQADSYKALGFDAFWNAVVRH